MQCDGQRIRRDTSYTETQRKSRRHDSNQRRTAYLWRRQFRPPKLRLRGRQLRFQHSHLFHKLVGALGFRRIHPANGEAHMDHHIVAQSSSGTKFRDTWRTIPPNCTRAARNEPISWISRIFPGMARHTAVIRQPVQHGSLPRSVTNGTPRCDGLGGKGAWR